MNWTSAQSLNEMVEYPIPNDVRQFILESVVSIAQLEALLLLRGSPDEEWTAQKVAGRLYISEQEVTYLLTRLCAEGLIAFNNDRPPLYRYQPDSDDLAQIVDRLAETYSKHLVPVTNLVHSKPRTRVREFADAFHLRKDE
jgi:predicted ArsR family transcriptional regulator